MKKIDLLKKKVLASVLVGGLALASFIGCGTKVNADTAADKPIAKRYSELKRLTIINTRTDKIEVEVIGALAKDNLTDKEWVCIDVSLGNGEFREHSFYINENCMYMIEDLGDAEDYDYKYNVDYLRDDVTDFRYK